MNRPERDELMVQLAQQAKAMKWNDAMVELVWWKDVPRTRVAGEVEDPLALYEALDEAFMDGLALGRALPR